MNDNIKTIIERAEEYTDEKWMEELKEFAYLSKEFQKEEWEELWLKLQNVKNDRARLVIGMECIDRAPDESKYEIQLDLLYNTNVLNWSEKYYLWGQIESRLFVNAQIQSDEITSLKYKVHHQISQTFQKQFLPLERLKERNKKMVFVVVQQFLSLTHGPTKTTLDRAEVLKKYMGKQVVIINTAEQGGGQEVGLIHKNVPTYYQEKCEDTYVEYHGEVYPYMQFDSNMPNVEDTRDFLAFIQKYKPEYIVNIGSSSPVIDVCSHLVPTININTVPSRIACIETTMQVIGRKMDEVDNDILKLLEKTKDDVIKGRFTSSLKKQEAGYTRDALGIDKELFLIAVVGGRLTRELDEEFRRMIDDVLKAGAVLMIIGKFEQYEEVCRIDEIFAKHSIYVGFQQDVLAVLELCNLYVNPKRTGGGTSVIEAMYKELPVVTLNYGDVALGAGEDFCVENYEDMKKQIFRYMSDKEYYKKMSKKARIRADYMLDSTSAFMEIMEKFQQRIDREEENGIH